MLNSPLICVLFHYVCMAVELVMYSEAIQCKARSREYKGRCAGRNCNLICRHENFQFGKCTRGTALAKSKCYCYKPCHGVSPPGGVEDPPVGPGTGTGGSPPSEDPPAAPGTGGPPPSEDPPAAGPGGEDTPPAAGPGGDDGSGSSPPGDDPPVGPGGRGGVPPTGDTPPTGPGSSRQCKSSSREYKGKCTSRNCQIICKHERFVYGKCLKTASKKLKCYCYKPCHAYELAAVGGGGGDDALPSD